MHLFDEGWNKVRETIFANQKRLGILPANAQLTPWPKDLPKWDSLSFEEKKLFIKQADVYGDYLAYADHEISRVIQSVEDLGELDNTLIIYIGGDNDECRRHDQRHAERIHDLQRHRSANQGPVALVRVLGVRTNISALCSRLGVGDGHAVQMGETSAIALRWNGPGRGHVLGPATSMRRVAIRREFHHVIDVVCHDPWRRPAYRARADTVDGVKQLPIEGTSIAGLYL